MFSDAASPDHERELLLALSPTPLPGPPPDPSNAFADDPAAARLGQRWFFDPLFSGKLTDSDTRDKAHNAPGLQGEVGRVSCATCHLPESAFSDTRSAFGQISLAAGWGRRRAPSLLDVGQAKLLTWDGRRDTMYNQVIGVLESPVEANSSRLFVAQQIAARYAAEYEAVFGKLPAALHGIPSLSAATAGCQMELTAQTTPTEGCEGGVLHGVPGDKAEYDALSPEEQDAVTRVVVNVGKAIGAYERLLSCGPGRFDRWMHGDETAMSAAEKTGARLFVGKAKCVSCHSGPYFSDQRFHNVGLRQGMVAQAIDVSGDEGAAKGLSLAASDPLGVKSAYSDGDDGRLPSGVSGARGAFRTPGLRCSSGRPSFMHAGQLRTLPRVVEFFTRGGDSEGYPGEKEIAPLSLDAAEQEALVAFLSALDGAGPANALLRP